MWKNVNTGRAEQTREAVMAAAIKVLLGCGVAGRRGKLPNAAFGAVWRLRVSTRPDQDFGHSMCF